MNQIKGITIKFSKKQVQIKKNKSVFDCLKSHECTPYEDENVSAQVKKQCIGIQPP